MRRQEVGYVLLEECEVVVIIPDGNEEDELLSNNDIGTWHTVDLKSQSCNDNNHCDDDVLDLPKDVIRRELVLRPKQNRSSSFVAAYAISPFHGLLSDSSKERCDASILAGLAIEIDNQSLFYNHQQHHTASQHGGDEQQPLEHYNDIRFLSTESAKIMFLEDISKAATTCHNGSIQCKRIRAAFLTTFSFPVIQNDTTYNSKQSNNQTGGKKALSTAFQLLGSIIRCDWNNLDTKKLVQCSTNDNAEIMPFFPQKLTVENLYDRISGASKQFGSDSDDDQQCHQQRSCLGILPEEIVQTSIAPYLKARSLHSLRLTNRRMYNRLRSVVPGLKLELFQHQKRSLEWMELRERRCIMEEDLLRNNNDLSMMGRTISLHDGESVCGGDYHRSVTGGATVKLCARPNNTSNHEGGANVVYRFDALSGRTVDLSQLKSTKAARGGLLCDEPGLGKTVTVLSLILRSLGLSVDATTNNNHSAIDDESIFHSYWESEYVTVHVRRPAILKLITRLLKSDKESGYFLEPISSYGLEDYFDVIKRGDEICFQDIRNKANKGDCIDFRAFEADVYRVLQNAMTYNHPSDPVHKAASRMVDSVKSILLEFKSEQVNTAMKSLSRIRQSDSTSLISILEGKKRAELHESLISSSSTLLVVPNPLLKHWEEQILSHIDFQYYSKEQQHIVYYHTKKKNVQASSLALSFDLQKTLEKGPFCFIDDGSKELPPASVLARFTIVLTAYNRFTAEWKLGSLEHEKRASRTGDIYWGDDLDSEASPILKVHWLRLIVDEGHTMGKNPNNTIQFCSWITAQRRWGMTGTPTQQIANQTGLRNLFFLCQFLDHTYFLRTLGREKHWNSLINNGWKDDSLASFYRLKHLLSYLMVRHTKQDLVEIPPPIYSTTSIPLSQSEKKCYNTLSASIKTNIITTSMKGKTSGWQDSLLNPRNSKYASEALTNLRISCCGSLQILPSITNTHWAETLEMLKDEHGADDTTVGVVNNFIYRCVNGELSGCQDCGVQLQTLFVLPCGHLICPECIDSETTSCPVCDAPFDIDDFQRLQPGIDFQFSHNIEEEKKKRESNRALSRALHSTSQSSNDNNMIDLDELDEVPVVNDERQPTPRKHKSPCKYSRDFFDGKCTICREEHFDCNFMNAEERCYTCFKYAEMVPEYASKAKYVCEQLIQWRTMNAPISPAAVRFFAKHDHPKSVSHRPVKAIVFSQFRSIYEYFGNHLIRRFGGACIADYSYGGTRSQELEKFTHDPECFAMLLSKQGSLGLDLSFVTHIILLDTIYDQSLFRQVVARAYRMGAKGPVFVEQLTAEDTIEEVMLQMKNKSHNTDEAEEKHAKLHFLLKHCMFVKPKQSKLQMNARKKRSVHDMDSEGEGQIKQQRTVRFKD